MIGYQIGRKIEKLGKKRKHWPATGCSLSSPRWWLGRRSGCNGTPSACRYPYTSTLVPRKEPEDGAAQRRPQWGCCSSRTCCRWTRRIRMLQGCWRQTTGAQRAQSDLLLPNKVRNTQLTQTLWYRFAPSEPYLCCWQQLNKWIISTD